ncbi:hypothetical protein VR010_03675 [Actinomycetaceae bacterium L2_0104]
MKTNTKAKILAIVGLTATLGLGACAAGIDSEGERGDPTTVASSPASEVTSSVPANTPSPTETIPDAPDVDAVTGSETGTDSETDIGSDTTDDALESGATMREELAEGVVTELTCPTGVVDINATASVVEVVEDCGEVNVTGDVSTILTQKVGTLNLDATSTVVVMTSADYVNLSANGSINTVTWESGNPVVNDQSTGSVVVSEN